MSSKVSNKMVQVTQPDDVRNVVLIGSAGSGKTSLFEQLLKARLAGYRGEKDDAERLSQLYLASISTGDVLVNVMDAPGHIDFVGELRAGIRAADAAVFVVSASDGVDGSTRALWEECRRANLPRVIALTKLDTSHDDFDTVLEQIQSSLGDGVLATHVPVGQGESISGSIALLSLTKRDYSSGDPVLSEASEDEPSVEDHRGPLIEGIIQETEDDSLMDRYLEGEELDGDMLLESLMKAIATSNLFPVVPVISTKSIGIEELLGLIEKGFPTPSLHPNPDALTLDGDPTDEVPTDAAGPLLAQVIRTTTDPFAGKLSLVRIYSGTLSTDDVVQVTGRRSLFTGREEDKDRDHENDERIGLIQQAVGTELKPKSKAIAGEIVMLPKLGSAETGDTISSKDAPRVIANWEMPEPLLPLAIRAATRNDEDKLSGALQRLAVEDTMVRLARGASEQLVLWTTGQAHANLLLNRLKDRYGVNVEQEEVKIALKETLVAKATAQGRHVKQSGGHGQYAVCQVEFEPLPRGEGFEFVDKVVGGAVPRQFIPSVEKGIRSQMEKGVIAGFPMVDVRATLFDGKAHSVDSSDMAFQLAGAAALKQAAADPKNVALLEPIDMVTVTVGEEYMGAVMTDLSGRRGQLLGTDSVDHNAIIKALVPQLELSRYAIDLRGLAQGSGSFTREFHGYEILPGNLVDQFTSED